MLSATGPGSSTRFTSQSSASSTAMREATANNPLADLIHTEKSYLETLKIIDTQIAARWMKQIVSAAPDFSVALKCVHEILKVNKQFCSKLVRVAGDPRAMRELGDILMQWIDEMEAPYTNYAKAYIPNLDNRQDIVSNTSIQHLLENISANLSAHITLESLFSAPIERISYYKSLYSRLLDSTRPGRADYKILFGINQRIDALLQLANRHVHTRHAIDNFRDNSSSLTKLHGDVRLLKAFLDRVDCSRVVDFFSNMPTGYQLRWSTENTLLLLQDSFIMVSERINASAVRMNFVLTEHELAVCREDGSTLWLMYPPFAVRDISVKAVSINRELLGEYILQLSICESRQLVVRASTKLQRNIWLGLSEKAPSAIAAKPKALTHVVNLRMKQLQEAQRDTATVSTASSVVTESKTKSGKERREAVRDTIMEFYDRRFSLNDDEEEVHSLPSSKEKDHAGDDVDEDDQTLDNLIPRSVKVRSRLPEPQQVSPLEAPAPLPNQPSLAEEDKTLKEVQQKMDSAIVQMTYIEPTTAHKMTITTEQDEEPDTPRVIPRAKDLTKNTATTTETVPRTISRKDVNAKEETKPGMLQSVRAALATSVATSIDSSPKLSTSIVSSSSTSQTDSSARSYDNSPQKPNISPTSPLPRTTSASQHNAPPIGDPKYRPPNPQQRHPPPQETGRPPREDSQLGRQQQQQPQAATPVQQQSYPTRSTSTPFDAVRGSYATDELSSPPLSPGAYANATRKILYTHGECEVFHWKDNTWYSAESRCSLQVRQTNANRACVSIQLFNSGQLYLNAWILPNTKIQQLGESDVSLSVYLGFQQENYLIHFQHRQDALALTNVLMAVHQESIQIWGPLRQNSLSSASAAMTTPQSTPASNPFAVTAADVTAVTGGFTGVTLSDPEEKPSREEGPQTLKPLLQCRCKLFAQQEHSQWNNIGSVNLHISQQMPSGKMHVQMDNGKTMLVSATIQSYNVERIQAKRLSFLLQDTKARTSMVYMLHFKDESTASKVFDYVKVKNAQNGW